MPGTHVNMSPKNAHNFDDTIELLAQSMTAEDEDVADALQDEALDVISSVAGSLDQDVGAPANSIQIPKPVLLHNLLFPKTSSYRLEEVAGKLAIVPIRRDESYGPINDEDHDKKNAEVGSETQINSSLPSYLPQQVEVVDRLAYGGGIVCLAQVDGYKMFCKARQDGLRDYSLKREIDCLHKISQAFRGSKVPIPKLLGYVRHPRSGAILGLLREWIPSKYNLRDLELAGFPDFPKEIRQKAGRQIKEAVEMLHRVGVIWGDAKPSNVVIDLNNDAWLVDFGGGWSESWVDENLQNTVEGDQQGVMRILEFLGVDTSPSPYDMCRLPV
ncbi:hypothetical protein DHEL01_v207339 [Diaporthe helianthi]|uniref:Protein kinase domain-containing protein n=1 Tax=Diaporthe helianthi TaxID=158607 RepID=A0A2P5HVH7_DIAHE|nr:hypothetical protein DHEL01_v207339 [Diaporthe helianthi]